MKPEARRALVERIFDKARENGQTIEDDPLFISWIEEWIAGDIEIAELREKYRGFLASHGQSKSDE
ncbi:hypothetical protein J2T09_003289 [Neorhizobium huautlense]|uniref:Antitoxin VbhA domain-containing protein n=1 Tax=Neorhizobium huautlense TaxID=67774 RepID=A0ABT9PWK5_9HYPH|nr:hypothetical protein [Neorhizobium huautlense]MDP9838521.1 hypothetical protein [Neorhizobium huautlense]